MTMIEILIVGASGGLGTAIARAFAAGGASLALVGHSRLPEGEFPGAASVSRHQCDLADPARLAALRDEVLAAHRRVDVVVNATGYDVRKPLQDHTADDFRRTLDVNLLGAMLLTQTFLPAMDGGVIVHLGGFADGRLAFPFYSADAATRAGVRAFSEAVNREVRLAGRHETVLFFSPSPADTDAERPFHPLWRELGTTIVAPEKVAAAVVAAVARREQVHIMGGWTTRLFAALNAVSPGLADALMMKRFGAAMDRFFRPASKMPDLPAQSRSKWGRTLGISLIVFSCLAYGVFLSLPLLSLAGQVKLALAPLLLGMGEASFWIGGVLMGKELVMRFRSYLNPCRWICKLPGRG
jgi:NAD(P)-dependent dehydrogenase (short-subunit alcohol dehydrogenase family)